MRFVYSKLKISGQHVDYYTFQKPIVLGTRKSVKRSKKRDELYIRNASINNARNRIIDIVRCNPDMRYFITLTYAKAGLSLLQSNVNFRKFIYRIKRNNPDFKYVAVPELQTKRFKIRKEFAIHYHLLWNLDLNAEYIRRVWGHGFIFSKLLEGSKDYSAFYISKYLSKSFLDEVQKIRPNNCQYYYCSRGLNRPKNLYGHKADVACRLISENTDLLKKYEYVTNRLGEINIYKYLSTVEMFNIMLELEDLTKSNLSYNINILNEYLNNSNNKFKQQKLCF